MATLTLNRYSFPTTEERTTRVPAVPFSPLPFPTLPLTPNPPSSYPLPSEAIMKALSDPHFRESKYTWLSSMNDGTTHGCAWGAAYYGAGGDPRDLYVHGRGGVEGVLASMFGPRILDKAYVYFRNMPNSLYTVLDHISKSHVYGRSSSDLASELRSIGL